ATREVTARTWGITRATATATPAATPISGAEIAAATPPVTTAMTATAHHGGRRPRTANGRASRGPSRPGSPTGPSGPAGAAASPPFPAAPPTSVVPDPVPTAGPAVAGCASPPVPGGTSPPAAVGGTSPPAGNAEAAPPETAPVPRSERLRWNAGSTNPTGRAPGESSAVGAASAGVDATPTGVNADASTGGPEPAAPPTGPPAPSGPPAPFRRRRRRGVSARRHRAGRTATMRQNSRASPEMPRAIHTFRCGVQVRVTVNPPPPPVVAAVAVPPPEPIPSAAKSAWVTGQPLAKPSTNCGAPRSTSCAPAGAPADGWATACHPASLLCPRTSSNGDVTLDTVAVSDAGVRPAEATATAGTAPVEGGVTAAGGVDGPTAPGVV